MTAGKNPDEAAQPVKNGSNDDRFRDPALDAKRDELGAAIAARQAERAAARAAENKASKTDGMAGMAYALRLSSEFIAGVIVGAVIGFTVDKLTGRTSPWGLIIFLLLGFVAGVLNVLRSAGLIATSESRKGRVNAAPAAAAPAATGVEDDEEED